MNPNRLRATKRKVVTEEVEDKIFALANQGISWRQIWFQLWLSGTIVRRYLGWMYDCRRL